MPNFSADNGSRIDRATFRAMIFKSRGGETMPYRLFIPRGYDPLRKYPLVVWLHGGEGTGRDNLKQISSGNWTGSHIWVTPDNQAKYPCFVVAPQASEDVSWVTRDLTKPTGQLRMVPELIEKIEETYSIDAERVYVAGQSAGGFATWSIISERPDMFAAAVPICGGGDESKAATLVHTPIWAFHGEKDEAVPAERSRRMIAALQRAGGSPRYTEYAGADHVIWEKVFSEPELLPWVFAQRRHL
ncbi:MAG TPA: prolyl oligopeptidase family serine peptidase [Pyrinomonadaceae bacterium]|nr:prolyl oligopeptidase family serine peptidase [Pyrinomonadaceae bacterium]